MATIFSKPLPAGNRLALPAAPSSNDNTQGMAAKEQRGSTLIGTLTSGTVTAHDQLRPTRNISSVPIGSALFSTRPTRTAKVKEPEFLEPEQNVYKYSVEEGLGPPWQR
jgi:hypothetical protein